MKNFKISSVMLAVALQLLLIDSTARPTQLPEMYDVGNLLLECTGEVAAEEHDLRIDCELSNKDDYTYIMLSAPLFLEGPSKSDNYLYLFVGGERKENVLQYVPRAVGTLDLPVLAKPVIHLSHQDLNSLVRLDSGKKISFSVRWASGSDIVGSLGALLARVKMIVTPEQILNEMLEGTDLTVECKSHVRINAVPTNKDGLVLSAIHWPKDEGVRHFDDGCRDRLAEVFRHLFSNAFLLGPDGDAEGGGLR